MKFTVSPGMPSTSSAGSSAGMVLPSAGLSAAGSAGAGQAWYAQGEALANDGAYERALRCFEEAAIVAPEAIEVLIYQAVCLIHLEQPQRALAVAERVLAIAPHHPQGWLYRGVALHRLGRYRQAYASYAQVKPA